MEGNLQIPMLRFPEFEEKWDYALIEEIFEFKNGLNKEKEFFGRGTPIINFSDVYHLDGITKKDIRGLVELTPTEIERFSARKGDVFFTRTSETIHDIGMSAVLIEEIPNCVFSGFVLRARPRNTALLNLFTKYCFSVYSVRKEIVTKSSFTTRALTSGTLLNKVIFSFPSDRNEQQKIADFLSTVDKKIQAITRKVELLEQYKKGLMQKIFKQEIRFKREDGSEFAEWEEKSLGEATKCYDGTHATPKYTKGGIPFYSVEHVTANQFANTKFISEEVWHKENKRVKLEKGDILMTRIGDIGTCRLIDWDVKASFYVSLALIKNSDPFIPNYLSQFIQSTLFQRELWRRTIHVAFPKKINLGEIGKCNLNLPDIDEQIKISEILELVDCKITNISKSIQNLKTWKKGLLQQMFV